MDLVSHTCKLGDVANERGDILVRDPTIQNPDRVGLLERGAVLVTLDQAEAAREFGWEPVPETKRGVLVEIARGIESMLN